MFSDDVHLNQLGQIIGFSPDDLTMNRQGKLTPRQMWRLRLDQRRTMWPSLVAWAVLGALVGTIAIMNLDSALLWLPTIVVILLLATYFAYDLRSMRGDLEGDHIVKSVVLEVDRLADVQRRFSLIEFQIGMVWLAANHHLASVWKPHHCYRIYYAPGVTSFPVPGFAMKGRGSSSYQPWGAHRILSMEPTGHPGGAKSR